MGKGTPGSFEMLVLSAPVCHHLAWPAVGRGDMSAGCGSQAGRGIWLRVHGAV